MGTYDKRVDIYIEKSADFAKPILNHLRELIHQASPEINETIKWSFPHFDYKGTVCSMASFKQHCAFGFWKSSLLPDPQNLLSAEVESAMGQFGRITSIKDLPADEILLEYIRNAVLLNETGVKIPKKRNSSVAPEAHVIPDYLREALSHNPTAQNTFDNFSNSHKREYIEWICEAKTEATREKRLATTILWLTEGKSMHWKYKK